MTLHDLTDIILAHFWIKKPACVTFLANVGPQICFSYWRVMTGYLSRSSSMVTSRIPRDVMLLSVRVAKERIEERKNERNGNLRCIGMVAS